MVVSVSSSTATCWPNRGKVIMNQCFIEIFGKDNLNEYCSGIFSDELDKLGYSHQVVDGWRVNNEGLRLFGQVRTLTIETIETADERISKGLGFLGAMQSGEVLVVKGSSEFAYFGELMSRLSQEVGVEGAIVDGLTRDTFYTQTIDLPIFARGYSPRDIKGRGRVDETDLDIEIGGVQVSSGDYVFADSDAVVFIPKSVLPDLAEKAKAAAAEEADIKRKISAGYSVKEILLDHKAF